MPEIRIHGRGGQGVVTAADLLAAAAFAEGRHAQAFPSFGSERMGAPVASFVRISEHPIRAHDPVTEPDLLVLVDPTLLHQVAVFDGLPADGRVLINSNRTPEQLGLGELLARLGPGHLVTVPATELAPRHLGRPMPNGALLGGLAALSGIVSLESVVTALHARFPGQAGDANEAAARAAFAYVAVGLAPERRRLAEAAGHA